jgi:hypothetical protein
VHDQPALAATSAHGEFGPLTVLTWIDDGYLFTVAGRADTDVLVAFADSLAPASLDEARQLRASIDEQRAALPALDRATLPNGFDVSVHTAGTGANVICLHRPIEQCQLQVSESSLVGDYQHTIVATFQVDNTAWSIGWAAGTHAPHHYSHVAPGEPITDTAQGGAGTFLAIQDVDGSAQFVFDPSDSAAYSTSPANATNDLLN